MDAFLTSTLLVAIAEMALARNIGCTLDSITDHRSAFGEDQARYVVTGDIADAAMAAGVNVHPIGITGGDQRRPKAVR